MFCNISHDNLHKLLPAKQTKAQSLQLNISDYLWNLSKFWKLAGKPKAVPNKDARTGGDLGGGLYRGGPEAVPGPYHATRVHKKQQEGLLGPSFPLKHEGFEGRVSRKL